MTRANVVLKAKYSSDTKLQIGSDGYPSEVLPAMVKCLAQHINFSPHPEKMYDTFGSQEFGKLVDDLGLFPGHVGNPYYYYEIDLEKGIVRAWESQTYWVNAPVDWEEKGWNCYKGSNGKFGYTNWRKGKKIFHTTVDDLMATKKDFEDVKFFMPMIPS